MSRPVSIVVLDGEVGELGEGLLALWEVSAFRERLEHLGEVVSWGITTPYWECIRDSAELSRRLQESEAESVIIVEPTQLFLDEHLAAEGLEMFDPKVHDVFTQWEHCRLPVGVGVRAFAARTWFELVPASPADLLGQLRDNPKGRKFAYDTGHRVDYSASLLDARFDGQVQEILRREELPSWGLESFLALAEKLDDVERSALCYQPADQGARVDERNMPAAYGFESAACAEFPTYVMFDITNVCNAACIHCPQSIRADDGARPGFLLKREHQTMDAFRRVIDECAQHDVRFVRITADGEPLVHPDLFEMLEYAQEKGVGQVGLTTNGSLVREEQARRLLKSGIAMIDFSLDAVRAETFHEIRVGLKYDRVRDNVLRFVEMRDSMGAEVKVIVSFVKQESNLDELEEFKAYWGPRVDEIVIREMISNVGLNDPSENLWPGWDQRWPCAHFFRRVVINHRGQLKACPIDWEQRTVNQHVAEASIFEQWHGDFYWSHRMQHLNDAIVKESACRECPDWAGTPWELGYEKIIERLSQPEAV